MDFGSFANPNLVNAFQSFFHTGFLSRFHMFFLQGISDKIVDKDRTMLQMCVRGICGTVLLNEPVIFIHPHFIRIRKI